MTPEIEAFNDATPEGLRAACHWLAGQIAQGLPGAEAKVWHRTAVWFQAGNPLVGYAPRKAGLQLLFWSGQDFGEPGLAPEGKFRAAGVMVTDAGQPDAAGLARWLAKAQLIQWDYAGIVKRKGRLEKLGEW